MDGPLDSTDEAILQALQDDARNVTTEEIGEQVGIAASTAASRLADLEERGVIEGYMPVIDYEKAGYDYHMLLVGTIRDDERDSIVDRITEIENVISVTELLVDENNVHVELISRSQERTEDVVEELNELGLEITTTGVVTDERDRTFDHFGTESTSGE
ncbi:Lrp/AsnC family transcriptional regulator [Halopiger goleimassiliensis]|uniref:Lrp/AsnC family transcriptional regulator n=1 Tax=Halopiger goleimassiliensis TaxID=1293048 RepID=UPI000677C6EB|nr:winged helix-turn-helix transcriptional regulator [Halopiger goleimassiliensis]